MQEKKRCSATVGSAILEVGKLTMVDDRNTIVAECRDSRGTTQRESDGRRRGTTGGDADEGRRVVATVERLKNGVADSAYAASRCFTTSYLRTPPGFSNTMDWVVLPNLNHGVFFRGTLLGAF
ncbi:hypothetical protein PIB30_031478 [Stylosanthes scabra]|uniref:Uncharacterized protein n=1 Tax=Stylosanthes scabra TaxID=79078 RepID=A0ABU6V9X6_9FABA|nr:hypothetical protein [Stylosanthes scabra]